MPVEISKHLEETKEPRFKAQLSDADRKSLKIREILNPPNTLGLSGPTGLLVILVNLFAP